MWKGISFQRLSHYGKSFHPPATTSSDPKISLLKITHNSHRCAPCSSTKILRDDSRENFMIMPKVFHFFASSRVHKAPREGWPGGLFNRGLSDWVRPNLRNSIRTFRDSLNFIRFFGSLVAPQHEDEEKKKDEYKESPHVWSECKNVELKKWLSQQIEELWDFLSTPPETAD